MSRLPRWRIADVLDFEYLLSSESGPDEELARTRDRQLYLESIAPHLPAGANQDRSVVFRHWLERRREILGAKLPGGAFDAGWQALLLAGVIAGIVLGAGLTAGLLHYQENEPVNAIEFLKWTLLPQWLFLLSALGIVTLRRALGWGDHFQPVRALLRVLIDAFAALLRRLPGDKRASVNRTFARIREHRERFGALATWPLVIATQVFAVSFNLGILGTLLTEVTVRELRFGWQTTLEVRPEQLDRVVRAVGWPWGWLPQARPSLEQIAATRYAPGQRHETLRAEAMRSWWPFLACSVGFYGLAVRSVLLLLAVGRLRATLGALRFSYPEAHALWHRMLGPVIAASESRGPGLRTQSALPELGDSHAGGACWVLVAQELPLNEAELSSFLGKTFGWQVAKIVPVKIDNRRAARADLDALRTAASGLRAVVIIAPAPRDPIVAIALFLKEVLGVVGKETEGLLLLAGSEAELQRLQFWRDFKAEHQLGIGLAGWRTK